MREALIFKACRFPRGGPVVVSVWLLCLGFSLSLLSSPARGAQDPSALGMANVLRLQRAPVNAPPLEGSYYPFALAEEAEEDPVNAGLLRMLLLAGPFFGASVVGWLLPNAQGRGALCFSSCVGEVMGSAREEYLPFLGVFRL